MPGFINPAQLGRRDTDKESARIRRQITVPA